MTIFKRCKISSIINQLTRSSSSISAPNMDPWAFSYYLSVLRIRIYSFHMLLDLPDPDLDPLVRDTDPDTSIIKQK
jgi:hypothetical protein